MTESSRPSPQGSDDSRVGVIIVAAGQSRRMAGRDMRPVDKVFAPLLGKPLIAHTVQAFEECPEVGEIVLVLGQDNVEEGRRLAALAGWKKLTHICLGGARRQDSVRAGLQHLSPCRWVMVHDGARPCVPGGVMTRAMEAAVATGAAVPAVPVNDTVKRVSPEGTILDTVKREGLWAVQTPQVFRADILAKAHEGVPLEVTDDAALVERLGHEVKVFWGSYENIKVTTQEDLALAEAVLKGRADS